MPDVAALMGFLRHCVETRYNNVLFHVVAYDTVKVACLYAATRLMRTAMFTALADKGMSLVMAVVVALNRENGRGGG